MAKNWSHHFLKNLVVDKPLSMVVTMLLGQSWKAVKMSSLEQADSRWWWAASCELVRTNYRKELVSLGFLRLGIVPKVLRICSGFLVVSVEEAMVEEACGRCWR